jgi:negative regulator of flagellin synthesis FlgM
MPNKINGLDRTVAKSPDVSAVSRARQAAYGDAGARAQASTAGIQITEGARQLAALEATIRKLPQVDEARVARIRKAIEDGSYTIDADATATKLMVFEHDLESLTRSAAAQD